MVALDGSTVAVNEPLLPTGQEIALVFNVTELTLIVEAVTVTWQVAYFPLPSWAVHVMVAIPGATAVSLPVEDTVATFVLLDLHATALLVALDGSTVAVNEPLLPTGHFMAFVLRITLETGIFASVTVTVHFAVLPLPLCAAVMTAVPAATACTLPDAEMVATEELELFHVTAACAPETLDINAVSIFASPFLSAIALCER